MPLLGFELKSDAPSVTWFFRDLLSLSEEVDG
jgi:hypothetical protein